jgi:MFS family permease
VTARRSVVAGWAPILVHAVLVQVFTYAARPALSYGVLEAGASTALLGVLGTVFAVPALALALPSGRIVDRIGERLVAVAGAVMLVGSAIVALAGLSSIPMLLLATLLLGIGHLLSVISEQALVANRSVAGTRESAFGLYTLLVSVGQILGPLLLAIPHPEHDGPWLSVLFAVCSGVAVALVVSSALMRGGSDRPSVEGPGLLASSTGLLRTRGVLPALVSSSLALSSVDVTMAFWPALSQERGLPVAVVSAMLAARALATMASRGLLPFLARRIRRPVLLSVSLALSAVALAATGLPLGAPALVATAAAYGLVIGVCQPITMAWLTDASPDGQRGMALSLRIAGNRVGQSSIPAAVGAIAPATGAAGVVLLTAASLIAAAIVSLGGRSRSDPRGRSCSSRR